MIVLGFPDYAVQGSELASRLGAPFEVVDLHRFPDGESRIRLPARLPERVVLCRSLDRPNDKLVEIMLSANGARTLGASHLTLVAPYLCYMRQDAAFAPGEIVSQRIIGRFLAELVDTLVTVDPHLHRVASLSRAVPVDRAVALSAAPSMGRFLAARDARPLLVGPDQESEQWVRQVAGEAGLDYVVARKTRRGDHRVEIALPELDYAGRDVVLVDDVASTGSTLAVAADALRSAGATRVDVLVTHALFVDEALAELEAAGVGDIWSSDSITHSTNAFALAPVVAESLT